jgi:hypothetical protein
MSERIVISGASGFLGRHLEARLRGAFTVHHLVRREPQMPGEIRWDPERERVDARALEGTFAIIHLAGETVAGRWTREKKRKIMDSRVQSTRTLATAIAQLKEPPQVWISASGVGIYGDRGDELLDENSQPGAAFLSEVCIAWEGAASAARRVTRVVHPRTGIVLSRSGGALERMLLPFRLGIGGKLGAGTQYMSFISLDDWLRACEHCLEVATLAGGVNFVAPNPVTNAEFTTALGVALGRRALATVPGALLKLGLGEFGAELLGGQRALPQQLLQSGFQFHHADVRTALNAALTS